MVQTAEWGWISVAFASTFVAALLLLAIFVARSRRVNNPLFDLDLFRSPTFRLANTGMLIYATGFAAMFLATCSF